MLGTFPEGAQPSGRTPPFPLAAYDETIKAWHFTELQRTSLFPAFLKSLDVYVWWCRYCKCACLKYIIHMNINVKLYSMYMDVQCPCMYMDGCHTSQWSDDGGGDEIALTSRCCCSRGKNKQLIKSDLSFCRLNHQWYKICFLYLWSKYLNLLRLERYSDPAIFYYSFKDIILKLTSPIYVYLIC